MRCSAILLLAVVACGSGNTRIGAPPSWRGSPSELKTTAAEPVVFAPAAPGVAMYNLPQRVASPGPLGNAVLKAVRAAAATAGIEPPFADARLFRACEELAQIVVEFAMQRNGLIEPSPHLLVVWGDLSDPALIVEQLEPHFASIFAGGAVARVGVGAATRTADGAGAIVFALQASAVTTNPIPRSLPQGGTFRLQGVVKRQYRDPDVLVTAEDGVTRRPTVSAGKKSGEFVAEVSCIGRNGKQQVEINAVDVTGSTVLANFPVWCGESPPTALHVESADSDPSPISAPEAEQRLLALVNRDRRNAGLIELLWSDPVAEVARKHSAEMRRTQVVAHLSPTTGAATDRLRAANVKSPMVLENVARAYSVGETHAGLMDSPGHRQNLMSPLATHIGIGVVLGEMISGRPEMFVTQVFTRVPRPIEEREVADSLHALLSSKRVIPRAAALERLAQRVATDLARGTSRTRAWAAVEVETKALSKAYRKVASVATGVPDLSTVDAASLLSGVVDEIGIGIAQGSHPDLGDGTIWIVLLLGELRRP
jgi:uncharacterized protein YkwD